MKEFKHGLENQTKENPGLIMKENVVLPLNKEELLSCMDEMGKYGFKINFKETMKNMNHDVHKFLIYISNCNMKFVYIINHEYDEDFENAMIEYVKLDRQLTINIFNELWVEALNDNTSEIVVANDCIEFLDRFRLNHSDYIEEIKDFYYSLFRAVSNIIDPTDEKLNKLCEEAPSNKLELSNVNIVSLAGGTGFFQWMSNLKRPKMYMYYEFIHPVLEGGSLSFYFIYRPTPFQIMYLYNQTILHPEESKKIIESIINKSN